MRKIVKKVTVQSYRGDGYELHCALDMPGSSFCHGRPALIDGEYAPGTLEKLEQNLAALLG